jgi:hypothetical protein
MLITILPLIDKSMLKFKFSNTIFAKFSGDPWVMGQVFNVSYGSWVSLSDPLSALPRKLDKTKRKIKT